MLSLRRSSERTRRRDTPSHLANTLPDLVETDRQLVAAARAGDAGAVAELYRIHHPVARGIARRTCRPDDVDDVVSEGFARVLHQLAQGGGPQVSFRAYLITAVRSAAADLARRQARIVLTDDVDDDATDPAPLDRNRPDSVVRQESRILAEALAELPSRWQLVVWWTTVEQRSLAEVARSLDISSNAAAALAFRARRGLRDAYVRRHLPPVADPACSAFRDAVATTLLTRPDRAPLPAVASHADACEPCRSIVGEIGEARSELARLS